MKGQPQISFVIPAKDEEASLESLSLKIKGVTSKIGKSFEVIFIDDGSTDNTFEVLKKIQKNYNNIKIIKLRGNWGKSTALQVGFDRAEGEIIITMDADLQDDPNEIPNFLNKLSQGYDMVSGWKKIRHDPISKTFPSKVGNFTTRVLTGIKIHDLNCGFKAYRRDALKNLNLYGELYKYIPVLLSRKNYKVGEIVVSHHPRKFGKSKFGWSRNIKGFLDLLTVIFLTGYLRRPGHFFGSTGIISFSLGFLIGLYITYLRIFTGSIQYRNPLLFLGILLMIIGIQLISTGLLAEMFIYSQKKIDYSETIEKII